MTEFGVEVVKFNSCIEEINRSYSGLKNALIQNFSITEDLDEIQIKNKLRSRGWSSKEIEFYPEFARYASLLATESLSMIYNVFMYRYFSLLLEYEIKRDAKIILNKMVVDALEYHISTTGDILTKRMSYHMKDNSDKRNHILLDKLLSSIKAVEEHNPYLNRFTDKQGFDLLISICSMLEISKKTIQDYISKFNSTLEFFGKDWMQGGVDPYFINGIMVKDSYKETRRQSQRMLSILNEMLKRSP